MKIYPSLISSDLLNLEKTLNLFDPHCDGYHIDIMDDHFVPNLTWGPAFVNAIRQKTKQHLNVHLMVQHPEKWPDRLYLAPKDTLIFHHEAVVSATATNDLIDTIHRKGWCAGIAANPQTSLEAIDTYVTKLDTILLMSVQPGFSGQQFIHAVTKKIQPLLALRAQENKLLTIGMDGGINENNIKELSQLGIDYVAVASSIFSAAQPLTALKNLYEIIKK